MSEDSALYQVKLVKMLSAYSRHLLQAGGVHLALELHNHVNPSIGELTVLERVR